MIKDLLLVGIGSGIGGIFRYLISVLMGYAHNGFHKHLPCCSW